MNAFFLIDKPLEMTSFDVIRILRKKLNTSKMGHTGTLDPLASGALLIAVGNYTKLIPYIEKAKKTYEFTMSFDGRSESLDLGTPVEYISEVQKKLDVENITREKLQDCINQNFLGEIHQTPPKYSALKINGKKSLNRVLDGEDFEIPSRTCYIHSCTLVNYDYPHASFRVEVSAGTYIRSLAADIGSFFGTGGYVTKLRRTQIEHMNVDQAQSLEEFEALGEFAVQQIFPETQFIDVADECLTKLNHGLRVVGEFDFPKNTPLFVTDREKITNVIFFDGEELIPKRKIV